MTWVEITTPPPVNEWVEGRTLSSMAEELRFGIVRVMLTEDGDIVDSEYEEVYVTHWQPIREAI